MIDLHGTVRQLAANAAAVQALAQAFPEAQGDWYPDRDTWSMRDVLQHLYDEERGDFRRHLHDMLGQTPPPWERVAVAGSAQALAGFLAERQASITWLSALESPDWAATKTLHFGPDQTVTLSAGDMLVSWVEHDNLHLRQMVELLHAWCVGQAPPYSVRYAGEW